MSYYGAGGHSGRSREMPERPSSPYFLLPMTVCPYVFHRRRKRILAFYTAWRTACRGAGLSDKIPHDFRRTAVRNMVRAGRAERVAMQISGHKTRSIFDRSHIVSDGDPKETAKRLHAAFYLPTRTLSTTLPLVSKGKLSPNSLFVDMPEWRNWQTHRT